MRNYAEITPEWEKENGIVAFGGDDEHLTYGDADDYIENFLDGDIDPITTMEVTAYRREKPSITGLVILDYIFERLDPELGDPDGCAEEPTIDMIAAANALALVVNSQYKSWACKAVETFLVDVLTWITVHRPDWLGDQRRHESTPQV